ncbi:MAG: hypothetical protein JO299_15520, partial [Gammaproteobacteria bacterium]|nr:hypothetical protein [Gammaproteobacteria bacterium]
MPATKGVPWPAVFTLAVLTLLFTLPCRAVEDGVAAADRVDPAQVDAGPADIEQRFAVHGQATYGRQ